MDGQRFGVYDTFVFSQGSAIKIPILFELFRRADAGGLRLRLRGRVTVRGADQTVAVVFCATLRMWPAVRPTERRSDEPCR
jgi:beta-lactamase class A